MPTRPWREIRDRLHAADPERAARIDAIAEKITKGDGCATCSGAYLNYGGGPCCPQCDWGGTSS